ncbi:MAG: ribulokinase [Clostridia bacterium]|nr:ribulokinase [Clostridia bacterium]
MSKYAIGIDYGTLSVRALLIDIHTGDKIAQRVYEYPHAVMTGCLPTGEQLQPDWALQHPQDYLDGLVETVSGIMKDSGVAPQNVVGLAIDVTASTILPVYRNKQPLCMTRQFEREPHAYIKMWKHHGGEAEAVRMTAVALERQEPWLKRYGGKISSEWMFPKLLETLHCAPDVAKSADYFLEVMDWLTWILTDQLSVSACGTGYKALCAEGSFPGQEYFEALDPELAWLVQSKMTLPASKIGECAGCLCPEMAGKLHLLPGIPIGVPIIDAHSSVLGGGISRPGEMMIIMGTSSCHLMLSARDAAIPGIQGNVRDGILPGFYGIEAGQSCVGDHFDWVIRNMFPETYAVEARKMGISPHALMADKLKGYRAGSNGLLALDWFNGVRSPLMDFDLNGLIIGFNLSTKPEDVYLALIEATAFGTRAICDSFEQAGVPVDSIILGGGIPSKNPFIVQVYADVLDRNIRICASDQACALGAAMLGIQAASPSVTGYGSLSEIVATLGRAQGQIFVPDPAQAARYHELYKDYLLLQDCFGRKDKALMYRLTGRRKDT